MCEAAHPGLLLVLLQAMDEVWVPTEFNRQVGSHHAATRAVEQQAGQPERSLANAGCSLCLCCCCALLIAVVRQSW
jgi:hypothetical protein